MSPRRDTGLRADEMRIDLIRTNDLGCMELARGSVKFRMFEDPVNAFDGGFSEYPIAPEDRIQVETSGCIEPGHIAHFSGDRFPDDRRLFERTRHHLTAALEQLIGSVSREERANLRHILEDTIDQNGSTGDPHAESVPNKSLENREQ